MLQRELLAQIDCAMTALTEELSCLQRRLKHLEDAILTVNDIPGDEAFQALQALTHFEAVMSDYQTQSWKAIVSLSESIAALQRQAIAIDGHNKSLSD